jgi:hypothetical protein
VQLMAALEPGRRLVNRLEVDPELRMEVSLPSDSETQADEQGLSSDESEYPYFPATDPVITLVDGDVAILGGFSPTSMDCQTVAISADGQVGDEALADAIRLELREDAATTDLLVTVHVRDGIVYLHGTVPDLVDSDNAAEVAARIPGVDEIIDLLTVTAMESHAAGYSKV